MSAPQIQQLETPLPSRSDKATFPARMESLYKWLVEQAAPGIQTLADSAHSSASLASAAYAAFTFSSVYKGQYPNISGPLNVPAVALSYDGVPYVLMYNINDAQMHDPGVSPAWQTVRDHAQDLDFDDSVAQLGATSVQQALEVLSNRSGLPIGSVVHGFWTTPPAGTLAANGSIVTVADYPELAAVFGTRFGGNGTTTFGLPDLRGVAIRGLDQGRGLDPSRVLGSYQADDYAAHGHTVSVDAGGEHRHGIWGARNWTAAGSNKIAQGNSNSRYWDANYTEYDGTHTHTASAASSGGSETRMKNVAALACVVYGAD